MPQIDFAYLKRATVFIHDGIMVCIAWMGAYWLRYNLTTIPVNGILNAEHFLPIVAALQITCFLTFGLYRGIWRFASIPDLVRIIKAVLSGVILSVITLYCITQLQGIPRAVFPLYAMLLIAMLCTPRIVYRAWRDQRLQLGAGKRVLIIGAGGGGEGLIRNLLRTSQVQFLPVAIVDDSLNKQGMELHGIRVVGTIKDTPSVVKNYNVDHIFVAIPTADSQAMRNIVDYCEEANVPFSTLPTLSDLASGLVSIKQLRDVSLVDLLGRDPVVLNWEAIHNGLTGQCVVITGAGGSIGSELTRQIAGLRPEMLILIDNGEFNLYNIECEINANFPELNFMVHLDNVTDAVAMRHIFNLYRPNVVFHAAAFKHVPLLQAQVRTAVHNNVIGTAILAETAAQAGVARFVLISTDKAVNPLSIMGSTKRVAELLCQAYDKQYATQFVTVRFGNVLGSAGSVLPLFQKQLQMGGPLTVTHPEMTRYFMTIPEASQLILQASVMGQGGEIFVLDMGEPVKIRYLAEQMIRLSGKQVGKDIEIIYTGLRPGEKLTEELFFLSETLLPTEHEKIQKARHISQEFPEIQLYLQRVKQAINANDEEALIQILQECRSEVHYEQSGTNC